MTQRTSPGCLCFARRYSSAALLAVTLASVSGCVAASADVGSCPTNAEQDVAAGEQLVQSCNSCHNFDTKSLSASRATSLWDSIDSGSMPPNGSFDAAQTEQVRVFFACATDAGAAGGSDAGGGGVGGSAGGASVAPASPTTTSGQP